MKLNISKLVTLSVHGVINSAVWPAQRIYRIGGDGVLRVLPGTGGICYSHQIGDSAIDLQGDHVEPGVSIKAKDASDNSALNTLACIGNDAQVISGDAKGRKGIVIGKHGGVDHVMVDFDLNTLNQLCIGDRIQIRAIGTGLQAEGVSDVRIFNCDPKLVALWDLKVKSGILRVPVTHVVPAAIMGSGLGANTSHSGDYDIQLFDRAIVKKFNLDRLRFGDIVAITDADHNYGRRYLGGAISIGVIVHSTSDMSGHGPGVTTLLSSAAGNIEPVIRGDANIGALLNIGRWRKTKSSARTTIKSTKKSRSSQ